MAETDEAKLDRTKQWSNTWDNEHNCSIQTKVDFSDEIFVQLFFYLQMFYV